MSLSIKICLIFALVCFLSDRIYCAQLRSSSSGAGSADQTCPNGYYCQGQCLAPRSARCTAVQSQECPSLDQSCNHVSGNYYRIQVGHAYLGFSGSKSNHDREHRFVIYRGFAYEFGGSYGLQVLDITDPEYKYANGRDLNSNGIVNSGRSSCSYEQAQLFADSWRRKSYSVFWRNCQHFQNAMVEFLQGSSCRQSVLKQDTNGTNAVMNEIESILTNCSIVCCNTTSTTSAGAGPSLHFVGLVVTTFIFAFVLF